MASYAASPPLPPAPLGETGPLYAHGSTQAKSSEYDHQQLNAPLPRTPTPQSTDDFTPQLPPRPPPSIHPSSRGNTGGSNGHSNTSSTLNEAETNVASPTSYISSPPLLLRPGRQGAVTPVQSLRGTKGLDFSQSEISEGGWTGPPPTSPPLSDPPSPAPSYSTLPQQHKPVSTQVPTQERPQPNTKSSLMPAERKTVENVESGANHLKAEPNATVEDGRSADSTGSTTPSAPSRSTLQPTTSRPLAQYEPQVPAQVTRDQEQDNPPVPRQSEEGRPGSQDDILPALL